LGQKAENITFSSGSKTDNQTQSTKITIDVEGAVTNPGVYSLETGGRIKEALISAGDLSSNSNRTWVERNEQFTF